MPRPDRRDRDDHRDEDRPRRRDDEPDDYDDVPAERPRRPPRKGGRDGLATVVPYRNGPALAAYYCGVFGLIPGVGLLLAPVAFILGIIGFVKARKNPKAHGTGHAVAGIILGIVDIPLWIVLWFTVLKPMTDPSS